MVYSLLSMLGTHDKDDMSQTLLAMSSSQDSCVAMRQSGINNINNNNNNNNNNNSVSDSVYSALIILRPLREFTRFMR